MQRLEDLLFVVLTLAPIVGIAIMQPSTPQRIIVPLLIVVEMGIAFVAGMAHRKDLDDALARQKYHLEKAYRR
jgi:hypothetical protein